MLCVISGTSATEIRTEIKKDNVFGPRKEGK